MTVSCLKYKSIHMKKTILYEINTSDDLFLKTLRKKVNNYFSENQLSKYGNRQIIFKTIFFLTVFFLSYFLAISNQFPPFITLLLAITCGLSSVLIVFNIAHDASHNALFSNKKLNQILTYTFNLVGSNAYMWNILHNKIHHKYPNIADTDPDIYQGAPFIRISPRAPHRFYHGYQHIYAPFLYLTYSLYLIYLKDFQDFKVLWKSDYTPPDLKHSAKEYIILFFSKACYLIYSLIIPLLVLDFLWWQTLIGYLIVHLFMSLLLAAVLIPVHMVDGATFLSSNEKLQIPKSWMANVFENTIDYSRKSKLANYFFGGLNAHLGHHLFPDICHVHLVNITDIIKSTAESNGLYYRNVTMWQAIKSHFKLLKKMGST